MIKSLAKKVNGKSTNKTRKAKRESIASHIVVIVSVMIIIFMSTTNIIIYSFISEKVTGRNKENMKIISNELYENFKNLIQIQTNETAKLALDSQLVTLLTMAHQNDEQAKELKAIIDKKLNAAAINEETTEHIFVTNNKGVIICDSYDNYINYDRSRDNYVETALQGITNMSSVHLSSETSTAVITVVSPIKDEKGNVIGTLGKNIYPTYFSQRFDDFHFLNTGFIFIVDGDKQDIYHPIKYNINKKNPIKEINEFIDKNGLDTFATGNISYTENKQKYISQYITVPELKSIIILTVPESEMKKDADTVGVIILISTIIMITIMVIFINVVIKRNLKPLKHLIRNTKQISRGNLLIVNEINSNNEIGQLAKSFNIMSEKIKGILLNIKNIILELSRLSDTLKSSQNLTACSMENITNSSESISSDNIKINNAIEESFNSFKNILDRTNDINNQSKQMIEKTNKIKEINEIGINTIQELKSVSINTLQEIRLVNNSFNELTEFMKDIKDIAGLVTNISKRTHILSLNASIEAARAGEAGNGFSVVAGQIRELSLNISEQMRKIDKLVYNINTTVDITKTNLDKVNQASYKEESVVNETMNNYEMVLKETQSMISSINSVNESINILNNENSNVHNLLSEVHTLSDDFYDSIEEINMVIKNQNDNVKIMVDLIEKIEHTTDNLGNNMNQFKM